jgi:tetratricopeptide (TPR) repeat protein
LADAARYLGRFDLSRSALTTLRKRSPDDASKAAFFLGRLEEARGNLELALDWYAQAMEGSPEPHFAQEAKAGKARIAKRMRSLDTRSAHTAP